MMLFVALMLYNNVRECTKSFATIGTVVLEIEKILEGE